MDDEAKAALMTALEHASPLYDYDWGGYESEGQTATDRYHGSIADEMLTALDSAGWELVRK
jgi:hypothetical protein